MRNEKQFIEYLAKFDKTIRDEYNDLIDELSKVGMSIQNIPEDEIFSFADYPEQAKIVADKLQDYANTFQSNLINGMQQAIMMSFAAAPRTMYGKNIWEEAAMNKLRDDTSKAWVSARMTPKKGLSLSQQVWNYTNQSKAEFEMAISDILTDGIKRGTSAAELAMQVKGRLNNPDAMYRRYHLKKIAKDGTKKDVVEWRKRTIDADGKVHFMSTDIEHPGTGTYRSARQNALRMTATEINTAYRYADCIRWQNEPYVTGIQITLSGNHKITDMCDDLQGRYPKWFMWKGWHPRCRCTMTSVLIDHDEFEKMMELPAEKRKDYVSPNTIYETPTNYEQYIEANRDRIESAIERGKQPWFIQDNYVDGDINKGYIGFRGASVKPGTSVVPGSTSMPFGQPQQTPRRDNVKLTESQVAQIMTQDRTLYTPEQLANMDRLEKIFGVPRGTSMSYEYANTGAENPLVRQGGQYLTNCQTCTVTHELRRRGFNVTAKGAEEGFNALRVNGKDFDWERRFLNADGTKIQVETCGDWAAKKGYKQITGSRFSEFFDDKIAEDGRYEIYCQWHWQKSGGKTGAHVFMAERKNGVTTFFDPQTGESGAQIADYFKGMYNSRTTVMRVDDKIINPHMMKAFNAEKGIVDTTGFVVPKEKTAIELAAEKRHAKRDVQNIIDNVDIHNALSNRQREVYQMLNSVARLNGEKPLSYTDLFDITRKTDGTLIKDTTRAAVEKITFRLDDLSPKLMESYDNYRQSMQKLYTIDTKALVSGSATTSRAQREMKAYIEEMREKVIDAISRDKSTYRHAVQHARNKYKDLLAERQKIQDEWDATRAARNASAPTPTPQKVIDPSKATSYAELKAMLGDEMPPILEEYEAAVARKQFTRSEYLSEEAEMERKLKDFFRDKVVGYGHFTSIENVADDGRILSTGIWNTQVEVQKGVRSRGDYYHQERCGSAEFFYKPVDTLRQKSDWDWQPGDYYRCAAPLEGDVTNWYVRQNTGYGGGKGLNAMVLFRNDKVVTTFTYENSLWTHQIPSLTIDPKVVSFDRDAFSLYNAKEYKSVRDMVGGMHRGRYKTYMEAQVYPLKSRNGVLGSNEIEAIILPDHPKNITSKNFGIDASKGVWDKWYEQHVTVYYYDKTTDTVKLYREGKPFETPAERAARLKARAEARRKAWDAKLKKMGMTREEYLQKLEDERNIRRAKARNEAQALINVADDVESKDLSLDNVRKLLKEGKYYEARTAAEEARVEYAKLKAREDALIDYLPNVKQYHKDFTIDDIEKAYNAARKDFIRYEREAPDDLNKQLSRLTFQRDYVEHPERYKEGRVRHSTWKVAQECYDTKITEVNFTIKKNKITADLADLKTYKTSSVVKKLASEAETLLNAGDLDGAIAKIEQGNLKRQELENKKLAKVADKLKVGESHTIKFDSSEFTQAKRDAAQWFKTEISDTGWERFKRADDYMSHYAEEMWKNLTQDEKQVLWLYTDGSKYISDEMLHKFGSPNQYWYKLESIIDGQIHNGLKDANILTTIIDNAPSLEEGMWLQSGKSRSAFQAIFGHNIASVRDLQKLVGAEGSSDLFMSCHTAKDGYFVTGGSTGERNDIVLNIYAPKGTKGVYLEPIASYGDQCSPKRGIAGYEWDGTKRTDAPSNQVEFLLQRGCKFKITKVYIDSGQWYVDVDLIEQTAQQAIDTHLPGLMNRGVRQYRPYS